jgi:hypothetical protein
MKIVKKAHNENFYLLGFEKRTVNVRDVLRGTQKDDTYTSQTASSRIRRQLYDLTSSGAISSQRGTQMLRCSMLYCTVCTVCTSPQQSEIQTQSALRRNRHDTLGSHVGRRLARHGGRAAPQVYARGFGSRNPPMSHGSSRVDSPQLSPKLLDVFQTTRSDNDTVRITAVTTLPSERT